MISLPRSSYGRAALQGSSRSRRGRLIYDGFSQPRHQAFSLSKPPIAGRRVLCKEAPFSAIAMGQQAQQGGRKAAWSGEGTMLSRLREAMVKERRPLQIIGLRTTTNVSNQCGHLSFVILALAYLETDVLALRGYAASGIGLSILFQFYRPQPLWIPIGWNGVFLLINASMIGLLLKERSEAAHLGDDPELERTYRQVFETVELTPVDFVRLMDLAERLVVPKGSLLSQEGRPQEEVFLIVEGAAEVEAESDPVGHLKKKQFVGSMAFNRFMQASPSATATTTTATTTADEIAADNKNSNNNDDDTDDDHQTEDYTDDEDSSSSSSSYIIDDSNYIPGGGGVFEEAKEVALNILKRDSIVGNMAQSFVLGAEGNRRHSAGEMERSGTTVTATTDVVVYAWDMYLLRAFIRRRPLAGAAFQKAISADLIRKVDQSRGPEERYRLLLAEALSGGVITPIEKRKLHRYRDMHGISPAEHRELLKEHEWREEDFEAGFQKGVAPRDGSKHFLKYEALLRRELAKGEVEDDERQNLREFRTRAGIDAQEHLIALEKQGWTADDYEVGAKGKAAGLAVRSAKLDNAVDLDTREDGKDHMVDSIVKPKTKVDATAKLEQDETRGVVAESDKG